MKKLSFFFLCILSFLFVFSAVSFGQLSEKKISIDPAYGGEIDGPTGFGPPYGKHLTLDAGIDLRDRLRFYGATVTMTRTDDTNPSQTARRNHFNHHNPDAAITIGLNDFTDSGVSGTETFWSSNGGSGSQSLATNVQNSLIEFMSRNNRGVKTADFTVLGADVPVCWSFGVFLSNESDYNYITSASGFNSWVRGHKMGFFDYLGITRPTINDPSPGKGMIKGIIYEEGFESDRIEGAIVRLNTGSQQTTDETGTYSFELDPGTYTVTASKDGYFDNSLLIEVTSGTTVYANFPLTAIPPGFGFEIIWSKTDYSWLGINNTERSMAYHNDKLYVANREESKIQIINASNGNETDYIDASSLSGGHPGFDFNTVAVSDDGYIFASNLTTNAETTAFRVYAWEDENDTPTLILTRTTGSPLRIGDNISVIGSVREGTAVLYAPISNTTGRILRYGIRLDGIGNVELFPAGPSPDNSHMELPGFSEHWGFPASIAPIAPDTSMGFFSTGRNAEKIRSYTSGNIATGFVSSPEENLKKNSIYISYQLNKYLFILKGLSDTEQKIFLHKVLPCGSEEEDRTGTRLAMSPSMGNTSNTLRMGSLASVYRGEGEFHVYALVTNNGIWAFTVTVPVAEIQSWEDLHNIRNNLDGHYVMDSGLTSASPDYSTYGNEWESIGNYAENPAAASPFTGVLEGVIRTRRIEDLTITDQGERGLFHYAKNAWFSNIHLLNVAISTDRNFGSTLVSRTFDTIILDSYASGVIHSESNMGIGGLVGRAEKTYISHSASSVNIVQNPSSSGQYNGGLVGAAVDGGVIVHSFAGGDVTGNDATGGLVGYTRYFKVLGSYARGDVSGSSRIGGLVGRNDGLIARSFSTGAVSGSTDVGGLVGDTEADGSVDDSFWDTETSGRGSSDGGTNRTTAQMKTEATFTNAGWDFDNRWMIYENLSYPFFQSELMEIGSWEELDYYPRRWVDGKYLLTTDLDADSPGYNTYNGNDWTKIGSWTPDDEDAFSFRGIFNGNGYAISDIVIDSDHGHSTGFFGAAKNALIADLKVTNADVTTTGSAAGVLVGRINNTDIFNCFSSGKIDSEGVYNTGGLVGRVAGTSAINRSGAAVNITFTGNRNTGGLVGRLLSDAKISFSFAIGRVAGPDRVGGLVGSLEGTVLNSYARGNLSGDDRVGGLAGWNDGSVTNSYSIGYVSGNTNTGGLIGEEGAGGSTTNSFWDVEVSGQSDSDGGTPRTNTEMKEGDTFSAWNFGDIWTIEEGHSYPYLQWETDTAPIQITSWADLNDVRNDLSRYYILMNELDEDSGGYSNTGDDWTPIGTLANRFSGLFDGNEYTIGGLEIEGGERVGLFGAAEHAKFLNTEVRNVTITAAGGRVGALIGQTDDYVVVFNCSSTGNITSTGDWNVGGLLGRITDTFVTNCWSSVDIVHTGGVAEGNTAGLIGHALGGVTISSSFATGNMEGIDRVGGLVGRLRAESTILNSYARGSVTGNDMVGGLTGWNEGSISKSYSTGNVSGNTDDGGLVGLNDGTVEHSFWDTETSGTTSSDGGTGRTTHQMRTKETFTTAGWDFDDIWDINTYTNNRYPFLRNLVPPPPYAILFEYADALGNYPEWMGTVNTERGITAYEESLYLLSRKDQANGDVLDLDSKEGEHNETTTITGASAGYFALNDIGMTGDGVLYGANLTVDASDEPFRVYRLSKNDAATEVITFSSENEARLGDKITVTGNWSDGGVTIYAADAEQPRVFKWSMNASGLFGTPAIISLNPGGTPFQPIGSPSVSPFPDGGFYWNAGGNLARKFNEDGSADGIIPMGEIPEGSNAIRYLGSVGDDEYLITYLFDVDMGNLALLKVPGGVAENTVEIFRTFAFWDEDTLGHGDVSFIAHEEGLLYLYVLVTNNAIAGYQYQIPDLELPDFSIDNKVIAINITGEAGWRMLSPPILSTYEDMFASLVTQGFAGADFEDDPANPTTFTPNLMWWDETEAGTTLQGWRTPDDITDPIPGGRGLFHFTFDGAQKPDEEINYEDELPLPVALSGQEYPFDNGYFDFGLTRTERDATDQEGDDYIDRVTADAGWNLIGNPTASTLDWDHGAWTKTNVDNSIYVWNPSENKYLVWNGSIGDYDGLISPFQAFWVKASHDDPVLRFTEDVKRIGGSFVGGEGLDPTWAQNLYGKANLAKNNKLDQEEMASLTSSERLEEHTRNSGKEKEGGVEEPQVLSMELEAGGMQARTWVMLSDKGRLGPDRYDAYRLEPLSNSWASAATAMEPGAPSLAINSLPAEIESLLHLPLYVGAAQNGVATEGEFELSWTLSDTWQEHLSVTLMDHQEKFALNMREKSNYRFAHATEAPLLSRHMREQSGFLSAEGKDAGDGVASASRPGIVYGLPGRIPFTFSASASDSKAAATDEWQKEKIAHEAENYRSGRSFRMDPEPEGFDEQRLRNPGAPPSGFTPDASEEEGAGGLYQEMSSRGVCLNVWGLQGGGAKTGGADAPDAASFPLSVSDEEADGPLFSVSGPIALPRFSLVISAEGEPGYLPLEPVLSQNYPNPFNSSTAIPFTLPSEQRVRLEVFDILGRRVAVLADGELPAGTHTIRWDASGIASGVYLYRMVTKEKAFTRKMTLVR